MSEIRKLIARWHRDELGAERKAARRKCSKALAPILDVIRKNAVHASVIHGMHRITLRLRYLTWKLGAWVLGLAAAARGALRQWRAESRVGSSTPAGKHRV